MARSFIAYDRDLPELADRVPWLEPTSHLVKDEGSPSGWSERPGRRPSELLLIEKLRGEVREWRDGGYEGAAESTQALFRYWFDEEHEVSGFSVPFRYHFCQREAIETLAYVVEVLRIGDAADVVKRFASTPQGALFTEPVTIEELVSELDETGRPRRRVRRQNREGQVIQQDLPPADLRRYAFKMATGSGKTWAMAMMMVWSYFHSWREELGLSRNFMLIAPNVIVYQRLARDFGNGELFRQIPLVPPGWDFNLKIIDRDDPSEPSAAGTLFLTNIQQLYSTGSEEWKPVNPIDAILGRKPVKDLGSHQRSILDRVKALPDAIVINDEAHHVHDEDLAWNRSLMELHRSLPNGLALWLDFSATPKDQNGAYYPWTLVDYPLAQAVEDRIVKHPIIVTHEDDPNRPDDPESVTKANVVERYGFWIRAAVQRWREHYDAYSAFDTKPVLFIMAEVSDHADAIGRYLRHEPEFGLSEDEVLVIHTKSTGEITQNDLELARTAANEVDSPQSKIKVIVSVMMLREGWDVRNVSVVLGLRPFTARAQILPEQVIGRGLRIMRGLGEDRLQTLEVLGTKNLLDLLRRELEQEGVAPGVTDKPPAVVPVTVAPLKSRMEYDIALPITKPRLFFNVRRIDDFDVHALRPVFEAEELDRETARQLKMIAATVEAPVGSATIEAAIPPLAQELVSIVVRKVIEAARLTDDAFAKLVPKVKQYLAERCFGVVVSLDDERARRAIARSSDSIAAYLAAQVSKLAYECREIEFERAEFKLSDTKPFPWRRNLPLFQARKTVFNYVATYNNFERAFAEFLDGARDVVRFAALGTTAQGDSNTQFRVDYLKPSGARAFYYPDWVVIQKTEAGEVSWIIETKGRVWENTELKDQAMHDWCERMTALVGSRWRYARVNQSFFEALRPQQFAALMDNLFALSGRPALVLVEPKSEEVASAAFVTHLPVYSLAAAAGYFGEGRAVELEGWVEAPASVGKLDERMFVAQIVGHSMEPLLDDGDYAIFRAKPVGTRQGKIVLAMGPIEDPEIGGSYTVKKYFSEKVEDDSGEWRHSRVRLVPANTEYDEIVVEGESDEVSVVAEYVGKL